MKHLLAVFLSSALALPAFANDKPRNPVSQHLKGEALRAVFTDTTMVGEYREYRGITRTYQYTEHHYANGTTDYVEGRKKEDGRWNIVGNEKICYKYPGSRYYAGTYCFYVFNVEGCYYKFTPRNMSLKRRPKNWNKWSSRAVRKGAGGSCEAPVG